jgi:uncharacterized membrane protein
MSFGKVEAGRGLNWLTEAIGLVFKNPVAFLVMGLILAVINFIPILGGLALTICGPALLGGIVYAAREEAEGSKAEIAHLFRAFQEPGKIGPMLLLCLPAIVGGAVLLVCGFVFGLGALLGGGLSAANGSSAGLGGAIGGGVLILLLVAVALMFLIYALQFFAVPRVMLDGIEPFTAMKESLNACLANLGAFLLFGIVMVVAFVVLAFVLILIPLIGWLALIMVATPAFACAEYFAWREVYAESSNRMPPPAPETPIQS